MSSVLDKIIQKRAEREKAQESDWRALAEQIANGSEPPLKRVEEILEDTGRTIDDLRREVRRRQRRKELAATLATVPQLNAEAAEIQRRIAEEDARLQAAEQAHAEAVIPLHAQYRRTAEASAAASAVVEELRKLADPEQIERLSGVRFDLARAREEHSKLVTKLNEQKLNLANEKDFAGQHKYTQQSISENTAIYQRRVDRLTGEVAAAAKKVEELEEQERAIEQELLKP